MRGWSNRTIGAILAVVMLTIGVGAMVYRKVGEFPKTAPLVVSPTR